MTASSAVRDPASLTWVGGGNDLASDPANWTPADAPAPGDTLHIASGTIVVRGDALAGDTLSTLPFGGTVTVDAERAAKLNLAVGPNVTVNVDVHGTLALNVSNTGQGRLNTSGGTIRFIGTNSLNGSQVFDDRLTGNATLSLYGGQGEGDLTEVGGAAGRGLTFALRGLSQLVIDRPAQFHAAIDVSHPGIINDVTFAGLHATSADLLDGILLLFNGDRLVDTARVAASGAVQLHQTSAGVVLSAGSVSQIPADAAVIPLQTFSTQA